MEPVSQDIQKSSDLRVWLLLCALLCIFCLVWLITKLGDGPMSSVGSSENTIRVDFTTVLPQKSPWLGINLATANIPQKQAAAVVVSSVMAGSPAATAGLQAGDIIERVNDTKIDLPSDFGRLILASKVGDKLRIVIRRDHISRAYNVELGIRPMGYLAAANTNIGTGPTWLGADVQPIVPQIARLIGYPRDVGIVVSYVYSNSPAFKAGVVIGDVIQQVGETQIQNIDQVKGAFSGLRSGDRLTMKIWRQGVGLQDIFLILESRPIKAAPQVPLPEAEIEVEAAWLGLDIIPLNPAEAKEFGFPPNQQGMLVDDVAGGAGVDAGFLAGDLIVAVNGKKTPNLDAFGEATEGAIGTVVDVIRAGRHLYISVPPPGVMQPANKQPPIRQVRFRIW